MSATALETLRASHDRLVEALAGTDPAAIEAASAELAAAVDAIRAAPPAADAEQKAGASGLLALLQGAQIRVNFLTDRLRRRADALVDCGARLQPAATYRRSAR
jgi:hypothetical protein